jgi:hypothetical protein
VPQLEEYAAVLIIMTTDDWTKAIIYQKCFESSSLVSSITYTQ